MNDIFVTVPTENAEEPRECKLQIVTFSHATCFSAGKFPGGERGTSHMKSLVVLVRKFELTHIGDHSGYDSSFICGGSLAEWSVCRTCNPAVPGSSPALTTTWICFSVAPSSNRHHACKEPSGSPHRSWDS